MFPVFVKDSLPFGKLSENAPNPDLLEAARDISHPNVKGLVLFSFLTYSCPNFIIESTAWRR